MTIGFLMAAKSNNKPQTNADMRGTSKPPDFQTSRPDIGS